MKTTRKFGLIGKNISYSFSKKYFSSKFDNPVFDGFSYENFDIQNIQSFPNIIKKNADLIGLNITIPYKESVIPFLDSLSKKAKKIGAVNVIKITKKGKIKGYNSDWYGFLKSIEPLLESHHKKALILGTGGASKAISFALKKLNIEFLYVSRTASKRSIEYSNLNAKILNDYQMIINCTPLGTSPRIDLYPAIPFEFITKNHLVYDLIYNPEKTAFLKKAEDNGAKIKNGYDMLILQAEKAWEIWNR